jgi:hypothetical protein
MALWPNARATVAQDANRQVAGFPVTAAALNSVTAAAGSIRALAGKLRSSQDLCCRADDPSDR